MNNTPLTDQADRTAAIEKHNESIFIDAGAGTGKTETIVNRIVSQIIANPDFEMDNIAAITFTEKAGAELRNRFRRVLLKAKQSLSPEAQIRIEHVISSIDSAAIGTIHAFCKRILTDHSIAAKLPVGFQIGSESAGPRSRLIRARHVADLAFDGLTGEDQAVLRDLDFEAKAMQELVIELDEKFAIIYELTEPEKIECEFDYEPAVYRYIYSAIKHLKANMQDRRDSGEIEFDDLLIMTRDLLDSDPVLRDLLSEKYRVLLVDEFQDTDPVQWHIVRLITQKSETDTQPKPSSLVLVGDPKQSIYRFRNADINTFIKVKDSFVSKGKSSPESFGVIRNLTSNFRSVKPIIDFVNWLFQDLAEGNPLGMGVPYNSLAPVHDPKDAEAGAAVRVLETPRGDDGKASIKIDAATECDWTAKEISWAINQKYKVTVKGENHTRVYRDEPATFGDVCILVPVRTQIGELIRALGANGVPFVSADPGIVFTRPLVLGLRYALKVVAQLDDDMALWAALKSPLFGLTDEQLVQYKSGADANWNIDGFAKGDEPNVLRAMQVFYDVRQKVGTQRPSLVLRELLSSERIFEKLFAETGGTFEATALRTFINHATQWENEGNTGLLEYADTLEILVDGKSKSLLPIPKELNQDAVQIMTIHASKGLEFPITVLSCMSGNPSYERSKILISKAGKIEFNLGKDAEEEYILSAGYEELRTGEDGIAEREEANRLLYVAMTRAQDHLVVSSLVRQANSRSAVIEDALKKLPVQKEKLYTSVDHSETVNEEPGIRKSAYVLDKNFKSDFEIEIAESNKRHVVSPSSEAATEMDVLARARVEDVSGGLEDFEVSVQNQDFETASEMSSALRDRRPLGKALHGVMDLVISFGGIPDQETLQSFLWQQAEKHGAMLELISLTKRVGHLLKHPIVLEALEAEQRWPELHLAIADPNDDIRLAEGFADLVYKTAEGYILVDYKTDKDIGASQIMHYQQQLGAYALILEKLTGSLPTKILLLHAEETGTTDIELYID